jgi:hypothetical protein
MSKVFGVNGLRPEAVKKLRTDVRPINDVAKSDGKWTGCDSMVPEKETGKRHLKMGGGKLNESKVRPKF